MNPTDHDAPAEFWYGLLVAGACGALVWGLTVLVGWLILF
jgi:hypothetical protein